jgi:Holliday junction resolvase
MAKKTAKPKINSRQKGKRGELEFAQVLRDHGLDARRGQQFSGGAESPDVVSGLKDVHFEVKRVEAGNPYLWMEQAQRDAKAGSIPVVAHRKSNQEWLAIIPMDAALRLLILRDKHLADYATVIDPDADILGNA